MTLEAQIFERICYFLIFFFDQFRVKQLTLYMNMAHIHKYIFLGVVNITLKIKHTHSQLIKTGNEALSD